MEDSTIKSHYLNINLPGGIVSVGDLSVILDILEKTGVPNLRFGTRQQLYFEVNEQQLEEVEYAFVGAEIDFEFYNDSTPNIVSSYVAEDIFTSANWLREGVYKDVLDTFNYTPTLKIDLIDASQTLIPFFSGNLNFISSSIGNYWHLYVRFPKTNVIYNWSSLVYAEDIARLSEMIERMILPSTLDDEQGTIDGLLLETQVKAAGNFLFHQTESSLKLPEYLNPHYEGFNKYNDQYCLGIYRRQEEFSVSFLKDLCDTCNKLRIGQLYTTPWKSILLKGLAAEDRKTWEALLDKHLINVCHASNELNWQTEDLCSEGLNLKQELVRAFNDEDLRTDKLCFAIKMRPRSGLSGSVVIRKRQVTDTEGAVFDVLHSVDFNPNSRQYYPFAESIAREELVAVLTNLCQHYYQQQTLAAGVMSEPSFATPRFAEPEQVFVQQCQHCLSIYDESWGTEVCSICDAPLADFRSVNLEQLRS